MINYATLREYINSNVKKVLWVYYEGNDLRNLENEKKNNILKKYLSNKNFSQNIKFRQDEINNIANSFILEKAREKERNLELEKERKRNLELWKERKRNLKLETNIFKLIKFIKIFHTRNLISSIIISSPSKTMPAEFKKTLQLTKEIVEKNNSKLYFIYLPEYSRNITIYDNTNYNFIKKMVVELEIPFIDIQKLVFEKEKNALSLFPFELKGHYNVLGYRKVAEMIYKFTKD